MIDVHCASLTSQGEQHRVVYLDGHLSRYQPCPTSLTLVNRRDSHTTQSVNPGFCCPVTEAASFNSIRIIIDKRHPFFHFCHFGLFLGNIRILSILPSMYKGDIAEKSKETSLE